MHTKKLSASSYSNTAPLVWSFIYGQNKGKYELILDTAPSRSAQLLSQNKVDVALVPVIAYQEIKDVKLIPDVCVGAKKTIGSVVLVTKDMDLTEVKKVSLDASSKTSVALTKIVFREFLGFEPKWEKLEPNPDAMLSSADCALIIGDPALKLPRNLKKFDLAELWHKFTGHGFIFAMWMTRLAKCEIDFKSARDEGLLHLDQIVANYKEDIGLSTDEFMRYLKNIAYSVDDSMYDGLKLYFKLAKNHRLIDQNKPPVFVGT